MKRLMFILGMPICTRRHYDKVTHKMKLITILLFLCLWLSTVNLFGACVTSCTKSGTIYTCSDASYDCINDAVSDSDPEDTIRITDTASKTWATTLTISKGITVIGPGSSLVITAGATPFIRYAPIAAVKDNNYAFRISSFTVSLGTNKGIMMCSAYKSPDCTEINSYYIGAVAQTKIRIDNMVFTSIGNLPAIDIAGPFYGVVNSNTFSGFTTLVHRAWGTGTGQANWDNFGPYTFGTANSMYYEDNQYTDIAAIADCDLGGRYVARYNTISLSSDGTPLYDYHGGGAGDGDYGCFGGSIYGNHINRNGNNAYMVGLRTAHLVGFINDLDSSPGSGGWSLYTGESGANACPPSNYYSDQIIHDSYFWNNRRGPTGTLIAAEVGTDNCGSADPPSAIVENTSFWNHNESFDGTVGMGCGTLASRPATCTTGVGYWATTQSCSDLTGMVGVSPTTKISGTLYKCTATNTWTAYYTPYTYPHPLRSPGVVILSFNEPVIPEENELDWYSFLTQNESRKERLQ